MQKKTSELLNQEICQRFGIDGLEFRGHFTEEEMVNQEGHILNDLAYMANTLKIKEDDIGLGGFHLTVSRIVGGETTHGAYFPNARVMATYYNRDGLDCGAFAHEWFHALDHQIAQHFHLKNDYFTNAMIAGEIDDDSVRKLVRMSPDAIRASEGTIRERCEKIEQICGMKPGVISSHAEISARSFESALVRNTDHPFLGEYESYNWTPVEGMRIFPTKDEEGLLCAAAVRTVNGASRVGLIQALKQDRGLIKDYPDLDLSEIQGIKRPPEEIIDRDRDGADDRFDSFIDENHNGIDDRDEDLEL